MNFIAQLSKEHSKENSKVICMYLIEHPQSMKEFMSIFLGKESHLSQRAAMVVTAIADQDNGMILPYLESMVLKLKEKDVHVAVKRNIVRVLQEVQVDEHLMTELFDLCIGFVKSPGETIAVKAFSMKVLVNICLEYKDLKQEVIPVIEEELERNPAKGVQSRGKAMLKALHQL